MPALAPWIHRGLDSSATLLDAMVLPIPRLIIALVTVHQLARFSRKRATIEARCHVLLCAFQLRFLLAMGRNFFGPVQSVATTSCWCRTVQYATLSLQALTKGHLP